MKIRKTYKTNIFGATGPISFRTNRRLQPVRNLKCAIRRSPSLLVVTAFLALATQLGACTNSNRPIGNQILTNVAAGNAVIFGDFLPVGMVIAYAGDLTPNTVSSLSGQGWLFCDGSSLAKQDFPALYRVLGTIHGNGNNTATFRLPDYRGRFLRGVNRNSGRDTGANDRTAAAPGGYTGDRVGSTQGDSLGFHEHDEALGMTGSDSLRAVIGSVDRTPGMVEGQVAIHEGDQARETRPTNANVHYLVYAGIRTDLEN